MGAGASACATGWWSLLPGRRTRANRRCSIGLDAARGGNRVALSWNDPRRDRGSFGSRWLSGDLTRHGGHSRERRSGGTRGHPARDGACGGGRSASCGSFDSQASERPIGENLENQGKTDCWLVCNKVDLSGDKLWINSESRSAPYAKQFAISAATGSGVRSLDSRAFGLRSNLLLQRPKVRSSRARGTAQHLEPRRSPRWTARSRGALPGTKS